MARRRPAAEPSPVRIVPSVDAESGVIEFKDGRRTVPDWQQKYLASGENYLSMTYDEWVERAVSGQETMSIFRRARTGLIRQHFGS